jgi:hypothetical protein
MSKESSYKSDKELEDLLRKIADSAEIPFSKEDWRDMKARLDELPNPTSPTAWYTKKRMVWIGAVFLGLLFSLALWNFLPVTQEAGQATNRLETRLQPTETQAEETEAPATSGSDDARAREDKNPPAIDRGAGRSDVASPLSSGNAGAIESTALRPEGLNSDFLRMPLWEDQRSLPVRWESNPIPPLDHNSSLPENLAIPEGNPIPGDNVETEKKSYRFAGRFSLSVQAAPDLSGIKLNQVEKAGNAVGIGAAYFLSPRLSLASGVFYSFKPYSSEGEVHYGSTDQPDWIFGECDILDIPFNLRYYPLEGRLQRAFVSVGLSSYLMLKEHYELEYDDSGSGYPYTREINVSGENNHFFGVVNISAGYERKLGRQLSVQVEPYFKVPISGVGEGDISLKSTGLFVGLNYYPGRKK